jgi:UDP-glucuronate decarboxylase
MSELAQFIFAKGQARNIIPPDEQLSFNYIPAYPDDVLKRVPDVSKAVTLLGWQPTMLLDEALDICIDQLVSRQRG